jgi:hypothetical protein
MSIANWTSIQENLLQDLHYLVARFNEKGCLQECIKTVKWQLKTIVEVVFPSRAIPNA